MYLSNRERLTWTESGVSLKWLVARRMFFHSIFHERSKCEIIFELTLQSRNRIKWCRTLNKHNEQASKPIQMLNRKNSWICACRNNVPDLDTSTLPPPPPPPSKLSLKFLSGNHLTVFQTTIFHLMFPAFVRCLAKTQAIDHVRKLVSTEQPMRINYHHVHSPSSACSRDKRQECVCSAGNCLVGESMSLCTFRVRVWGVECTNLGSGVFAKFPHPDMAANTHHSSSHQVPFLEGPQHFDKMCPLTTH